MALVLIDVDGTLILPKDSEIFFGINLLRCGVLGKAQIGAYVQFYLKWIDHFGFTVAKKNKAYLSGLELSMVETFARQYVQNRLQHRLRTPLVERIMSHHRSGDTLVLLTGTLDCIAQSIAELIGVKNVEATLCAMNNGYFCADPPVSHPYGIEKLRIAQNLSKQFNTSLSDCTAYADSIADLPLLSAVSNPVAVAPDRKLAIIANEKRWEILR